MTSVSIMLWKQGDSIRASAYKDDGWAIATANCDTKEHALRALADNLADIMEVEGERKKNKTPKCAR